MHRIVRRWLSFIVLATLVGGLMTLVTPAIVAAQAAPNTQSGVDLSNGQAGSWGTPTGPIQDLINQFVINTELDKAAQQAQLIMDDLAQGRVPVISDLADPFQGNVQETIENALAQAKLATDIMNEVAGPSAKIAFDILSYALAVDGDWGVSLPIGRARLTKVGTSLSLCITVVGPGGARVTTGISNASQLCGVTAPRLANPSNQVIHFADVAVGYTHMQTRRMLAPSLHAPLTTPPPYLQGETYVNIHGQWVQIRMDAADPGSVEIEAEISVGIKGGVNYAVKAEVEGEATLSFSVKPFQAATMIQGAAQAMVAKAEELNVGLTTKSEPDVVAEILRAGLQHLYDEEAGEGLGAVSVSVGATGQLGIGIWDTGLAGGSLGGHLTTTVPLESYIAFGAQNLERLIDIGLAVADTSQRLNAAILEGRVESELLPISLEAAEFSGTMLNGAISDLLDITSDVEMELGFKITVLGKAGGAGGTSGDDDAPTTLELLDTSVTIPVGTGVVTLLTDTNAIPKAIEAIGRIATVALAKGGGSITDGIVLVDPIQVGATGGTPPTTLKEEWEALSLGMVDGINFTMIVMGVPLVRTGIEDVSLAAVLQLLENRVNSIEEILGGLVRSARTGSIDDLRGAIEVAIGQIPRALEGALVDVLKTLTIPLSVGFGGNVELGAEAQVNVGLGGSLNATLKTSLLLLLANHAAYDEEHDTVLGSIGLPVSLSLSGGAAVGEAVEVTIDAGGTVSLSLFDITLKHWEGELPPPAAMTVAGFELFDFVGTVNEDESFNGTGYLMLPMGGIVKGTFDVDAQGNVRPGGSWTGGLELGPLGDYPLLIGRLDNDGLHGQVSYDIAGNPVLIDFNLQSSGTLYGGYEGSLNLDGFEAYIDVELYPTGFRGTAYMDLLGSRLEANDLFIPPGGPITGTFRGQLVVAGHTFSEVELQIMAVGLQGTSKLDLPGALATETTLILRNGAVTARASTMLMGGFHTSQVELGLFPDRITVTAGMQGDLLDLLNGKLRSDIDALANQAIADLQFAQGEVDKAKAEVAKIDAAINTVYGYIEHEKELARQALRDAERIFNDALGLLNGVLDQAAAINRDFASQISQAEYDVSRARTDVSNARNSLGAIDYEIWKFDNWYYSMNDWDRGWNWLWYQGARAALVTARGIAEGALWFADGVLWTVEQGLAGIRQQLQNTLAPVLEDQRTRQAGLDWASGLVAKARQDLESIPLDPNFDPRIITLKLSRDVAQGVLDLANQFLKGLEVSFGALPEIAQFIEDSGITSAFRVLTASFESELGALATNVVSMDANVLLMNVPCYVSFTMDFDDPLVGVAGLADKLLVDCGQGPVTPPDPTDTTPPQSRANSPLGWQRGNVSVSLAAVDDAGGSGVALISFSATGAQTIGQTLVPGANAVAQINGEGVTTLSFQARDVAGNLEVAKAHTVQIDLTKPQATATAPQGWEKDRAVVAISATDNLSGVASISYSATGAQPIAPTTTLANPVNLQISAEGVTTISYFATDGAGNVGDVRTVTVQVDRTAPQAESQAPVGWQNQDTTVGFSATDNPGGSGVASISYSAAGAQATPLTTVPGSAASLQISTEGVTTISYFATDAAGNVGETHTITVQIDRVAPQTQATAPQAWQIGDVTVALSATDNVGGSGVASITVSSTGAQSINPTTTPVSSLSVPISAEGTTTVSYYATDAAGNVGPVQTVVVRIDLTKPEAAAVAPEPWQNQTVTVGLSATDQVDLSGVASITYSATGAGEFGSKTAPGSATSFQVNAEGTTMISYFATDVAGNAGDTHTIIVRIDLTKPVISGAPDRPSNQFDWYNAPVTVAWTCTDALSGVDPNGGCSVPETLSGEGANQFVDGGARDVAGNTEVARVTGINIDLTAPYVVFVDPLHGAEFTTDQTLILNFEGRDGLSGIDTVVATLDGQPVVNGQAINLFDKAGMHTLTVTTVDKAGNPVTSSVTYKVKIRATVDCGPEPLNHKSNGQWVTCLVEFPVPYSANTIDGSTVKMNGQVQAYMGKHPWAIAGAHPSNTSDRDEDSLSERMLRFDRKAVQVLVQSGNTIQVTLTGRSGDVEWVGTTTLRVN